MKHLSIRLRITLGLAVILALAVLLFGGSKIPELARGLGKAKREFKKASEEVEDEVAVRKVGPVTVTGDGPLVVREKTHPATPINLEQALYEMELVGHDFYLFVDKESEKPSVVYRRRGYDYGVISLDVT